MKVKLLVYSSYLGSGGAEKHTVRILNELSMLDYSILIVCPDRDGDYEKNLSRNIKLKKVGSRLLYKLSSTFGRMSTYWGLKSEILKFNPDIVFSIQDIHNVIAIKVLKNISNRPKLILAVQNSVEDAYLECGNVVDKYILRYIREEYQYSDKIIALSKGVKEGLIRLNPLLENKIEVIYNAGLDDDIITRFYSNLNVNKKNNKYPILISCGRLTYQKGYPYMFEALKILKAKNIEFEYHILGKGELENELKQLVKKNFLESNVVFLGFQADPFSFFSKADIFVLPSLYEGFGNVIVEAMASGIPVVSTNCSFGPNEIITSPELGVLVPVKSPLALAEALEGLINNPEKRKSISIQSKTRALDFRAKNIAFEHDVVFKQIIS